MPHQRCTVVPPTFRAAIPVGAVTATAMSLSRAHSRNRPSRVDLPVPACPVRKTFPPVVAQARNRASGVGLKLSMSSITGQVVVVISRTG